MKLFEKIKTWWDEKCPNIPAEVEYGPAVGVGGVPWYERKSWAREKARIRRRRPRRSFDFFYWKLLGSRWKSDRQKCALGKELDRLIAETVKNGK